MVKNCAMRLSYKIIMETSYCFGVSVSSFYHPLPVTLGCELDIPESIQKFKSYLFVLMRTQHNALTIHIPTNVLLTRLYIQSSLSKL